MRLSDAKNEAKPLDVNFAEGAVLHITYSAPDFTPNEASRLMGEANQDPRRIAEMICRTVRSWDLTTDDDQPIPVDVDTVADVPISVLSTVVAAIQKDQMPGEAGETSSVG